MADVADVEGKLKCLKRELKLRQKVYPRLVAGKQMSHEQASYELDMLARILADYTVLMEEKEPKLKLC